MSPKVCPGLVRWLSGQEEEGREEWEWGRVQSQEAPSHHVSNSLPSTILEGREDHTPASRQLRGWTGDRAQEEAMWLNSLCHRQPCGRDTRVFQQGGSCYFRTVNGRRDGQVARSASA